MANAARSGHASFDALPLDLSATICCGKCHDRARQTLEFHPVRLEAGEQAAHRHDAVHTHRVGPIDRRARHHPAATGAP